MKDTDKELSLVNEIAGKQTNADGYPVMFGGSDAFRYPYETNNTEDDN